MNIGMAAEGMAVEKDNGEQAKTAPDVAEDGVQKKAAPYSSPT